MTTPMTDGLPAARVAYSIREFAEMVGTTEAAVRQSVTVRRVIPSVRVGRRVMIPADYVDAIRAGRPYEGDSSAY